MSGADPLMPLAFPHVVVMESDLDVLDQLGHLLHQLSVSVTMVSNVLDLETLKRIAPHVIVLGLSGDLPHEDRELLRHLRSDARTSRIPTIFRMVDAVVNVGVGAPTKSRESKMRRCSGPLLKPYDFDDIVATILGEITIQEFHYSTHLFD
ncbi:MAG: hypothetical protein ACR2OE_04520 [Thermomicrobiales bacterium]